MGRVPSALASASSLLAAVLLASAPSLASTLLAPLLLAAASPSPVVLRESPDASDPTLRPLLAVERAGRQFIRTCPALALRARARDATATVC